MKQNFKPLKIEKLVAHLIYRKSLNNGPPVLHACTLFMYEIDA